MSVQTFARSSQRLSGSHVVTVLPLNYTEAPPELGIKVPDYRQLRHGQADYASVITTHSDYQDIMVGHPGHPGGVPQRPGGHGISFGVVDWHGTEVWLTEAEGLSDSPAWEQQTVDPALGDGTWLLDVRARGREVVLRGTLLGVSEEGTTRSVAECVGALSSPPRSGTLRWAAPDGSVRTMPVALSGQSKVKWRGGRWAELELTVKGIDIGTPGAGVFLESASPQVVDMDEYTNTTVVLEGTVPTPPTVVFTGGMQSGAVCQIAGYSITLAQALADGDVLEVNCQSRKVMLNGRSARAAVSLKDNRWPLMGVGAVPVASNFHRTSPHGRISLEVRALW